MRGIISFAGIRGAAHGDSRKVIGLLRQSDAQAVYNREILVNPLKS